MPPPSEDVFEAEREEFLHDVRLFLETEQRRTGREPLAFEVSFGLPSEGAATEVFARAESVLVFTSSTNGGPQVQHHRLAIKLDGGRQLALTPALGGPEVLAAVRQHLQLALDPKKRPR